MPAQWINGWFGFDRNPPIHGTHECACLLWWDLTAGDLSTFHGFDLDDLLFTIGDIVSSKVNQFLTTDWYVNYGNMTAHHSGTDFNHFFPYIKRGVLNPFSYAPAINVCAMKRTAKIGRSGVGRIFFPDVPGNVLTNGILNTTALGTYQTAADQLNATFTTGVVFNHVTLRPCLHSLQDNDLTPIASLDVLQRTTYLYRRRLRP